MRFGLSNVLLAALLSELSVALKLRARALKLCDVPFRERTAKVVAESSLVQIDSTRETTRPRKSIASSIPSTTPRTTPASRLIELIR